ncbi:hypothetical protein AKJ09_10454 [Labilithrix luteola]|uniref:Lipoprotein n=1 Tax=Labilithrix luteola TaxID=1391654 RepID=A0A0K1QDE5_9BACT|nr:hypothetical protein [Labilithrix luteola]AKV03791.1 hypothetical protein AKJ09_10454 [Labilithrix luteola]
MDKRVLLFLGSLSTAAAVAFASACSDDTTNETVESGGDAGGNDSAPVTPGNDAATPDVAQPDASAPGARVYFASDLTSIDSAVRICLLSSTTTDEPTFADVIDAPAFPDNPKGLAAGEFARLDVAGGKLAGRSLRVALFYAPSLDAFDLSTKSCTDIVKEVRDSDAGTGSLLDGVDFELAAPLPRTFFRDDRSYVVLATGCPRATPVNADYTTGECPGGTLIGQDGGFDGTKSYLQTLAYELDPTPATAAGKNRAQFIFGSSGTKWKAIDLNDMPPVVLPVIRYADPAADGGVRSEPILGTEFDGGAHGFQDSGVLVPAPGTEVTDLKTMTSLAWTYEIANSPVRERSVASIDALSNGLKVADVQDRKAYTFLFFGSPVFPELDDKGAYMPASYHVALIPND